MAIPLAPIATIALRYGVMMGAAYVVARKLPRAPRNQKNEDALDTVDEGVHLSKSNDQANATGRFRRIYRVSKRGAGVAVDTAFLARIKFKRVHPL
ncbi:hypothetical protein [Parasulfitobacter algicola]|uniref:Uncharacterized protein n=1 Tax=Parasulfitobacter algicola TaxID=2614809 RepID=A0ABX2IVR0_9RHOB|nr:hypothetical protein [Sulfitobacter algicola]NSX54128.1 hypothetical protein [Sulfitobacter algicola]